VGRVRAARLTDERDETERRGKRSRRFGTRLVDDRSRATRSEDVSARARVTRYSREGEKDPIAREDRARTRGTRRETRAEETTRGCFGVPVSVSAKWTNRQPLGVKKISKLLHYLYELRAGRYFPTRASARSAHTQPPAAAPDAPAHARRRGGRRPRARSPSVRGGSSRRSRCCRARAVRPPRSSARPLRRRRVRANGTAPRLSRRRSPRVPPTADPPAR
jgi:hypothetical protein